MIDLNRDGDERRVVIGYDALMRVIERDKVEVETGDMVCLHTGYADLLLRNYGQRRSRSLRTTVAPSSTAATGGCCDGSPTAGFPC